MNSERCERNSLGSLEPRTNCAAATRDNVRCFASQARYHAVARGRTNTAARGLGACLCPAAKGFQCAMLFQLRRPCGVPRTEEQRRATATRGCCPSMLDMNTVNKRTSLPCTNSYARQPRAIDTQVKTGSAFRIHNMRNGV